MWVGDLGFGDFAREREEGVEAFGGRPGEAAGFGGRLEVARGHVDGDCVTCGGRKHYISLCRRSSIYDPAQTCASNLPAIALIADASSSSATYLSRCPIIKASSTSYCRSTPLGRNTGPSLGGSVMADGGFRKKNGRFGRVFFSSEICSLRGN